ncbi:MAG: SDR family oxidoreductase [Gammaproteobacteria bacterium]
MRDLKRTVLVTGAGSGIGRAVAKKLLREGCRVIGTSRDAGRFQRDDPGFIPFTLDLSDLDQVAEAVAELNRSHPEIDSAVLCAGYGRFGSLEEFSYSQIQDLITVNFTAQVFLVRGLVPPLKKKKRGDVVFIGSEAALKGSRKGALYCAGKFALRGFSQALREECARSHVRVALVNPGMVKTEFFDGLNFEPGSDESNFLLPEDVAETVFHILSSRGNVVFDEINLNPLNRVVSFK